jgi:hypothetical protein
MPRESRNHRADGTPRAISNRRGEVRRLTSGVNDLKTLFPEIASEILDGDPTQVTKGSTRKYSWKCPKGHTYLMSPAQRTKGRGCAVCAGKQINVGVNDLASRFPNIASETDGWDPTTVTFSSNLNKKWKCQKGHIWKANINNRTSQGMGCPFCSGRFPLAGFNDLTTTHSDIAKEMHLSDPREFTFGSNKKTKWKCSEGHIWTSRVAERIKRGCPTCHIRLNNVIVGKNDLLTTHPEIAKQADGWDPRTISAGSGEKVQWKCTLGHIWKTQVGKRTSKDSRNCPVCSNQVVLIGFNDLETTHPQVAKNAVGWDPKTVVSGSNKKMMWKCEKGHEYQASVTNVARGANCLVCMNLIVQQGVNDLATTNPSLASQADGWDPKSVHAGSHKKMSWRCEYEHTWEAIVSSRKKNGCPVCGNRAVLTGFNDLATHFPQLAEQADGWDPTKFTFATTKKVSWKCQEGHRWKSTIKNRSQLDRGCPTCASSGFDPNLEGWLYLIAHPNWEMLQIGITNYPKKRLATHQKLGWEIIELRGPLMGDIARSWETAILRALKKSGASFTAENERGKFTGFSESWIKTSYPVTRLRDLMSLVEGLETPNNLKN